MMKNLINRIIFINIIFSLPLTTLGDVDIKGIVIEKGSEEVIKYAQIIMISKDTCIETFSNEEGNFTIISNSKLEGEINFYINRRSYLPTLITYKNGIDNQVIKLYMKSIYDFNQSHDITPTDYIDTNYIIRFKVIDSISGNPISGVRAILINYPVNSFSENNGDTKIFPHYINEIKHDENVYMHVVIEHKGYNTYVKSFKRRDLTSSEKIDLGIIKLKRFSFEVDFKQIIDDINLCRYNVNKLEQDLLEAIKSKDYYEKIDTYLEELSSFNEILKCYFENLDRNLIRINEDQSDSNSDLLKADINYHDSTINARMNDLSTTLNDQLISINLLDSTLTNNNIQLLSIKSTTESLYNSYISSEEMPDNGLRFYAGYNYGFQNRPEEAHMLKLGVKEGFNFINRDKFYFDCSVLLNFKDTSQRFDQASLNLLYRIYNRKDPYFSLDAGAGYSFGVRYNHANLSIREPNSGGINFEVILTGRLFGKNNRNTTLKDNSYFYLNFSDRFIFGGKNYNYGFPVFGIGLIYSIPTQSNKITSISKSDFLDPTGNELVKEINLLRSNPEKYLLKVSEYTSRIVKNSSFIDDSTFADFYSMKVKSLNQSISQAIVQVARLDTIQSIDSILVNALTKKGIGLLKPEEVYYNAAKRIAKMLDNNNISLIDNDTNILISFDWVKKEVKENEVNIIITSSYIPFTAENIICQLLLSAVKVDTISEPILLYKDLNSIAIFSDVKNGIYRNVFVLGKR